MGLEEKRGSEQPKSDILRGLEFSALPKHWTPLEAFLCVKCFDEKGAVRWAYRTTPGVNDEELLGAMLVQVDILRRELVSEWFGEEEEEDEETEEG